MVNTRLGVMEARFADLVWEQVPMSTRDMTDQCEELFNWKRTTTYTVLKKLCEKGIFHMEKGVITALLTKEEFRALQSERFVETNFGGSLPSFIAAFSARKEISAEDMAEIRKMLAQLEQSK